MTKDHTSHAVAAVVVMTGVLWGLYWLPVRALGQSGLGGAWGTVAMGVAAVTLLIPFAARHWSDLRHTDPVTLLFIAAGGAAFALYSVGIIYGRVALIILLFYLTPVWSTMIGVYVMGWRTTPQRIAAIAAGLAGLAIMLSARGQWPIPRGLGEWMALSAGVLWAISSTGMRARLLLGPGPAAFVFCIGALLTALTLALALTPFPVAAMSTLPGATIVQILMSGALWWAASFAAVIWAAQRLDPTRLGILLMSEVIAGAVSAALLAGEYLTPLEWTGGALVIGAGVIEVWPRRYRRVR